MRILIGLALFIGACSKSSSDAAGASAAGGDAAGPVEVVFEIYDGVMDERAQFRAKLRVRTNAGKTFEYKTPVSHSGCYLLATMTSVQSTQVVEGNEAHLVCSGGGQHDEATVTRTSDTLVEVTVFQKAFEGVDSPRAKPENVETFSITVPRGATLRTRLEAPASRK